MSVIEQLDGFRIGDKGEWYLLKSEGWDRAKAEQFARSTDDAYEQGYDFGFEEGSESIVDESEL
jgi:hypothetical protein